MDGERDREIEPEREREREGRMVKNEVEMSP